MDRKLRVYVMGPYSQGVPTTNVNVAIKMGDKLMELNFVPFIPHLTMLWGVLSPKAYDEWLDWDMEWLRLCDAAIRIPGFSPGADREQALCTELGIPVFKCLDDLLHWRKGEHR